MWNVVGKKDNIEHIMKEYQVLINHPPSLFYAVMDKPIDIKYSLLKAELPRLVELTSIQLPTLESNYLVVRFHHLYERDDPEEYLKPVEIDLDNLIDGFKPKKVVELSLTGTFSLEEVEKERMQWKSNEKSNSNYKRIPLDGNVFTIQPMEIRTFELDFN